MFNGDVDGGADPFAELLLSLVDCRFGVVGASALRCGFCPPDTTDFDQLLEDADDQLFERILNNPHHMLAARRSSFVE